MVKQQEQQEERMRIINTELFDEDAELGATPEILVSDGPPDGTAEPYLSAPLGSVCVDMSALDDEANVYQKVDQEGSADDWRLTPHMLSQTDFTMDGDWTWNEDHRINFRDAGIYMRSPADGDFELIADGDVDLTTGGDINLAPTGDLNLAPTGDVVIGGRTIDADGFVTLVDEARHWERDQFWPSSWAGGAVTPTLATVENWKGYAFTIGDSIHIHWRVPDNFDPYDVTTNGYIWLHWAINEAYGLQNAEVRFQANINAVAPGETEAIDVCDEGSLNTGDLNIPATAYYKAEDYINLVQVTVPLAAQDLLGIEIERVALGGGVDPTAEPILLLVEIMYPVSSPGAQVT
jgi:hypothetical protein